MNENRSRPRRNFTMRPGDAIRLDNLAASGRAGSKSAIVARGLQHVWLEQQAQAIAEFQVAAAAEFGKNAALAITGTGYRDLKLGELAYEGREIKRNEDGSVAFEGSPCDFTEAGWDTRGRWGYTTWDLQVLRSTRHEGQALITTVGIQILSGQGISPLGHKPFIYVAEGTHAGTRGRDQDPVSVWEWGNQSMLADDAGNVLDGPVPSDATVLSHVSMDADD